MPLQERQHVIAQLTTRTSFEWHRLVPDMKSPEAIVKWQVSFGQKAVASAGSGRASGSLDRCLAVLQTLSARCVTAIMRAADLQQMLQCAASYSTPLQHRLQPL